MRSRRPWTRPNRANPAERGQAQVLPHRQAEDEALALAILGQEAHAHPPHRPRRGTGDVTAGELDAAGVGPVGAEDQADELGPAGAHEPGDAQDLALVQVEGDVLDHAAAGEPAHAQDDVLARGHARTELGIVAQLLAQHQLDDAAAVHGAGLEARHRAPVAQHGNAVGHALDLGEAVGDVNDPHPLAGETAQDGEQTLGVLLGQRRGGLVEDEDARLPRERLGDLDRLRLGDAERGHRSRRVDRAVEPGQHGTGRGQDRPAAHEPRLGSAEEQVLGHGEARHQAQLLVDDDDPARHGPGGGSEGDRLAVQEDAAAVRGDDPAQDPDERALAGPVLAAEGVDLAPLQREVDPRERLHAGVGLADTLHLEEMGHGGSVGESGLPVAAPAFAPTASPAPCTSRGRRRPWPDRSRSTYRAAR